MKKYDGAQRETSRDDLPDKHPMRDPDWTAKNRGAAKAGFDAAHLKAARAQAMAKGLDASWPSARASGKANDNARLRTVGKNRKSPTPELKPESAKRRAPKRMKLAPKRVKEIAPVFARIKERVRGEESQPEQKLKSEFDRERE